jgi:conserved domain protein
MKKSIFHYALSALFVGAAALSATSCADDDINPNGGTDGDALVRFSINDVQEQAVSRGLEMTRGAIATGLSNADLAGGRLEAHNNAGLDVCLIETTVEGVNPIKADARTRADIIKTATLGDFSSTGIRGTSATSILSTPEWFKAKKTKKNGELYSPIRWAFSQPYARFFAVHPAKENYSKMTINDMAAADIAPSVDFEVEPNVRDQKDFMTACTGDVHYATRGVHPTTNLDFRHALTGIRFAVGQNLSWNKTIDKVEIRNAVMKSKYTLSKELNGTGATWHIQSTDPRGTATLSGVSVSTSESPNTTIMGNAGDNFTFYMIPQMLTGKGVTAYVHCTDGTEITAPLKGEWKAGTTRTYKLSQTNSTWQYTLTSTDPSRAAECNETTSQPYSITSYREDPVTHTKQAVAWKVIGYSVDNGTTWSTTKPAWLTALSAESGNGGTAAETGTATLTKDVKDLLKERNDGLKNATAVGTSSAPYDLSTHDLNGNTTLRSTANSYLISAPGHYRIPLVYGNAIKNGSDNPSSYQTSHTGTTILSNFQDHAGNAINDPWIEKTNGGANAGVNGAKIVWADEKDLVTSPSIAHDASNNAYLDFEVKAADIKSGNAVVAVTKGGTVVWSWHLWFAPQSALTPIPVTNYQNKVYNFTEETLGWKPTKWEGSTYNTPRTVKVRVEQTIANNGTKQVSDITITQNPGTVRTGIATLYQFGRKDAFPGMDETQLPQGSINKNAGNNMSITNGIQYPDRFYMSGSNWNNNYGYYNLWSADNMVAGSLNVGNDNPVVKTVYDPSPVGFKMPANNAFTGFTADGQNNGTMNVDGTDDLQTFSNNFGHNFWTSSSKTATIHFPASGYRSYDDGSLNSVGYNGYYWSAVPGYTYGGCSLSFKSDKVNPLDDITRSHGVAVRPVSE